MKKRFKSREISRETSFEYIHLRLLTEREASRLFELVLGCHIDSDWQTKHQPSHATCMEDSGRLDR